MKAKYVCEDHLVIALINARCPIMTKIFAR